MTIDPMKKVWEQFHKDGYNAFSGKDVYLAILHNFDNIFKKTDSVLEIGCGNGDSLLWLQDKVKYYSGIDISRNVCDKLIDRFREHLALTEVRECAGDGTIPFDDNTFDVVMSCLVMQHIHIKHVEKYIEESRRVLKNKGKILFHCAEWEISKSDAEFLKEDTIDKKVQYDYVSGGIFSHTHDVMSQIFPKYGFKLSHYLRTNEHPGLKEQNVYWSAYYAEKI